MYISLDWIKIVMLKIFQKIIFISSRKILDNIDDILEKLNLLSKIIQRQIYAKKIDKKEGQQIGELEQQNYWKINGLYLSGSFF